MWQTRDRSCRGSWSSVRRCASFLGRSVNVSALCFGYAWSASWCAFLVYCLPGIVYVCLPGRGCLVSISSCFPRPRSSFAHLLCVCFVECFLVFLVFRSQGISAFRALVLNLSFLQLSSLHFGLTSRTFHLFTSQQKRLPWRSFLLYHSTLLNRWMRHLLNSCILQLTLLVQRFSIVSEESNALRFVP